MSTPDAGFVPQLSDKSIARTVSSPGSPCTWYLGRFQGSAGMRKALASRHVKQSPRVQTQGGLTTCSSN